MLTVMKKEKGAERSAAFLGVLSALLHFLIDASPDVLQHLESCRSTLNHPAFCSL
jgi:hypothetical protein